ncbi:hypothetical protein [Streptomyces sp. NPDC008001]|uniref:hypothetical protein n=1 Tax=Streptomyces sp. NPDC008001 TaxID=3364804 RepID=UPI0036E9B835
MRHEHDHSSDRDRDDQPLFIRKRYGTRWVYNHRNPVGLALIVLTPLLAIGALLLMTHGTGR